MLKCCCCCFSLSRGGEPHLQVQTHALRQTHGASRAGRRAEEAHQVRRMFKYPFVHVRTLNHRLTLFIVQRNVQYAAYLILRVTVFIKTLHVISTALHSTVGGLMVQLKCSLVTRVAAGIWRIWRRRAIRPGSVWSTCSAGSSRCCTSARRNTSPKTTSRVLTSPRHLPRRPHPRA